MLSRILKFGLLALIAACAGWVWLAGPNSLAASIRLLAFTLPASQNLVTAGVDGSLLAGGKIQSFHWYSEKLSVEAHDIHIEWDLSKLRSRILKVPRLKIGQLIVIDRDPSAKMSPPIALNLPVAVDLAIELDTLTWNGASSTVVSQIAGKYKFDKVTHTLDDGVFQLSSGKYLLSASLEAAGNMNLTANLTGTIKTPAKNGLQSLNAAASARLTGQLASLDASLDLNAHLRPVNKERNKGMMQAEVQATLSPWRSPLVTTLNAKWQGVELSALWPKAPETLLDGECQARPVGDKWEGHLKFRNLHSGPLNEQRLPMQSLQSHVVWDGKFWAIQSLRAVVGHGTFDLTGQYGDTAHWDGRGELQRMDPSAWDTRLTSIALSGRFIAQQKTDGIFFQSQLSSPPIKPSMMPGKIEFQGSWLTPVLKMDQLLVELPDAKFAGALEIDTNAAAASIDLAGSIPGASIKAIGQLSAQTGKGDFSLQVHQIQQAYQWLERSPAAGVLPTSLALQGNVSLEGSWTGGWRDQGQDMQVQLKFRSSQVKPAIANSNQMAWRISDLKADIGGTLAKLEVKSQASLNLNDWSVQFATGGKAQRTGQDTWKATLDSLQLSTKQDSTEETWSAISRSPLSLLWKNNQVGQLVRLTDGGLTLVGPSKEEVPLDWQAMEWRRGANRDSSGSNLIGSEWQTKGQLRELPVAWLMRWAPKTWTSRDFRSDLVFDANWDVQSNDQHFNAQASITRNRGDLELRLDEEQSKPLRASIQTARVNLTVKDENAQADLVWQSVNAGTVKASAQTKLARETSSWAWPGSAKVTGKVHAAIPRLRVWSVLAPPGWRLSGTLESDVELSGTRDTPHWHGSVTSSGFAVRSLIDGVDFSDGVVRLNLEEDRLKIAELTLKGAGVGPHRSGLLSITGEAVWPKSKSSGTRAWRMELKARAQGLRVGTRADQRLVVSGELAAKLDHRHLDLSGALTADQAMVVLSDDLAQELGDDVYVRGSKIVKDSRTPAESSPSSSDLAQKLDTNIQVALDLGPSFQVRGLGISTRLAGKLTLGASGGKPPGLFGEIQTAQGTYKAYGQNLMIETGRLRFNGKFDNPGLDILAVRPNLIQRVGVQIGGTALLPVVRLYADPDMPDIDKLSWLVLGRGSSSSDAQLALLQQAALAMMGRDGQPVSAGLASALGLDEISVGSSNTAIDGTGTASASIKMGKRLASNFYLSYERSMSGTYGTFYIFYDLSKRLTLRGSTGDQSALDLIFTSRFD